MAFPDPGVLERVLTEPQGVTRADLPHLREAGLTGFTALRLPEGHALKGELLELARPLQERHAQVRATLLDLLRVWAGHDLTVLLLGGFALAEFEYGFPGERVYNDLTLLLPAGAEVGQVVAWAVQAGWWSDGLHADPALWTHEVAHLFHRGAGVSLSLRREVIPATGGLGAARRRALNAQVWESARLLDWEGVPVRLPALRDLALLVALTRAWGPEAGLVQPVDYTDLLVLTGKDAPSPSTRSPPTLTARAKDWGAGHTWLAFTSRCNPLQRVLSLTAGEPDALILHAARRDGVNLARGRAAQRWQVFRHAAPHLPAAFPHVMSAWWAVRRGGDPRRHLARWTPDTSTSPLPYRGVLGRLNAVTCWTNLLFPRQSRRGVCVPRSYAAYRALRRAGHPVVFTSGVTPGGAGLLSHAWVEDARGEWPAYELGNREKFRVVFQFPERQE